MDWVSSKYRYLDLEGSGSRILTFELLLKKWL